jgi:type II secretory pathway pseudopilin PulG
VHFRSERGYAMPALLVGLAVMAVMLTVLLPAWSTQAKREKEAELVFRGEQYARAIRLFGMRYANALPPNVDVLVMQKFLRKKYKDPVTGEDFVSIAPGAALPGMTGQNPPQGVTPRGAGAGARGAGGGRAGTAAQPGRGTVTTGVAGVASKSTDTSLRTYNGRNKYNEWIFVPTQRTTAAGAGRGAARPDGGVGGGAAPGPGGRGPGGRGLSLPSGSRGGASGPGR